MKAGILYSVAASALFALMPAYLHLLPPLHSYAVIGQRIVWSSIILTILLVLTGQLKDALAPLATAGNWPGLITGALIIGSLWGIFVWGPLNGDTLGVALGFFLAPLVLVVVGLLVFKDRLNLLQYVATILAVLAMGINLWQTGAVSWVALAIALGYPVYFVLRRLQPIPILTAFYIENLLLLPLAIWACMYYGDVSHPFNYAPGLVLMFLGLALLGTLGILCILAAIRRLPVSLFGLLSYLEPLFIFLVAIVLIGEKIQPGELFMYVLIGLAIAVLALDGIKNLMRQI